MRKQYYLRQSPRGLLAWDVDRLIELSKNLPRHPVPLERIRELDDDCFGEEEPRSWRSLIEHMKLIEAADLEFPIVLSQTGAVMDGMHRVARAAMLGRTAIEAVQFDADPDPDFTGMHPDHLPY